MCRCPFVTIKAAHWLHKCLIGHKVHIGWSERLPSRHHDSCLLEIRLRRLVQELGTLKRAVSHRRKTRGSVGWHKTDAWLGRLLHLPLGVSLRIYLSHGSMSWSCLRPHSLSSRESCREWLVWAQKLKVLRAHQIGFNWTLGEYLPWWVHISNPESFLFVSRSLTQVGNSFIDHFLFHF